MNIDDAWERFLIDETVFFPKKEIQITENVPKCFPLYISTKTQIAFLSENLIDLNILFWKIKILPYYKQQEGILKKQMKVLVNSKMEEVALQERLLNEKCVKIDQINKHIDPNSRNNKYKDVKKLNIGFSKKDLLSRRRKKTSAFYNCMVLIIRIFREKFREFHVKIFNTGKMEIPGIQNKKDQIILFKKIIQFLQPYFQTIIKIEDNVETVLFNSNFTCNFNINRHKLYNILKYKYNINSIYDPCSYPGIQCKFYFKNKITDGICHCKSNIKTKIKRKCCSRISCMFFRTGSVLIVGNCNETEIHQVYDFVKKLLRDNFQKIFTNFFEVKPKIKKIKCRKLYIYTQ